jgi:5-methylcytosine-specific restriction enzyme subunit McrC
VNVLDLTEWEEGLAFTPSAEERRALARVAGHTTQQWREDGSVLVGPRRGFVGSARLSPETMLVVKSKVPIRELLDLVALAYRTQRLPGDVSETSLEESTASDWVALLLTAEIESLLAGGLRRGYVERREPISFVRGRIDFQGSLRSGGASTLVQCEFDDFAMDVPENRLLLGTLVLMSKTRLHREVRRRVEWLMQALDVGEMEPSGAAFDALRLTRLNQRYEPALRLARLFVTGSGVGQAIGAVHAPAFFLPMEEVFERAVANACSDRIANVHAQYGSTRHFVHVAGGPVLPVTIRPDILIGAPPFLVADTKYASPTRVRRFGGLGYVNEHLYQVATYAKAHGVAGALIYPRRDLDVDVTYDLAGTELRILTVDLSKGLAGLEELVAKLSTSIDFLPA